MLKPWNSPYISLLSVEEEWFCPMDAVLGITAVGTRRLNQGLTPSN